MVKKYNNFTLQRLFPDPSILFSGKHKGLDQIKSSAIVSIDTNVMLYPYKLTSSSFNEIVEIYNKLNKKSRLYITGHVAREYARRRPVELSDLVKNLRDNSSKACAPLVKEVSFLDGDESYEKLKSLSKEIDSKIKESRTILKDIVDKISNPIAGDAILAKYSNIFSNCIYDIKYNDKEMEEFDKQCSERFDNKIPPGYHDENKTDNEAGDLLIWKSLIEISKSRNKDLIFVTGDDKGDWWIRSDKSAFQPRYELIDEFMRETDGKTIHIIPLHKMIETFDGSKEAINEAEELERYRIDLGKLYSISKSTDLESSFPSPALYRYLFDREKSIKIDPETFIDLESNRNILSKILFKSLIDEKLNNKNELLKAYKIIRDHEEEDEDGSVDGEEEPE